MMEMKSMWGSCRDISGGDRTHPVEPERLKKKNSMDISSKRHCGNCMILYLFHLIFKILFFFQVLYILTLKIIIDMHSVWTELLCPIKNAPQTSVH